MLKGSRDPGKPLKSYVAHRIKVEGLRLLDFVCGTLFGAHSGRIHDIVADWIASIKGWKPRSLRGPDGRRQVIWESAGDEAVFETPAGKLRVKLGDQPVRPEPNAPYTLMFRPEAVHVDAPETAANALPCVVRDEVYLGETTVLTLESSGVVLHASEGAAPERVPGSRIFCAVSPDTFTILLPETR